MNDRQASVEAAASGAAGASVPAPPWLARALAATREMTYPQYLLHRRGEVPDRVALVFRDRSWTYRQFADAVDATAQHLAADHGVAAGRHVVMKVDNSDAYVIAYFAVMTLGAVAVPINPKLTPAEVAFVLEDTEPQLFICDGEPVPAPTPQAQVDALIRTQPRAPAVFATVDTDVPAVIFYTSGTTGRPKGVIHTHRTLVATAHQAAHAWGYAKDGLTNLAVTPLFHVAAHAWAYPTWAHVGTLVIDTYGTDRMFELIQRHRVQGFGCVPSMLMMMMRSEQRARVTLDTVHNVRFGASPMPPDKLRDVQAMFPNALLYHGMGQTESGGTISVLDGKLALEKVGSTGLPLPGCEVRIVDENSVDLPAGVPGEVLARGPHVMAGYFRREQATAETLRDGWLYTGDVGYRDADGYIYLVDRKKDMIIRGGENIYSVEVENVLLQHDAVPACAVIGLRDELLGEKVCVVIGTPPPADPDAVAAALKAFCRGHLAAFKVPEVFLFWPELPQTATGKIQKAALRQQAEQQLAR